MRSTPARAARTARCPVVPNARSAPASSASLTVTPAVTLTSPTAGQVVAGTTPVRATTTGFTGARQYVLMVDGVQRQTGTITTDTFTLWFNTTRVANGTHTFTLRVIQAGVTATANVQVTVRN